MKFKREIELFWIKHSGRIISITVVFAVVILITQTLNAMAEKKIAEEKNKNTKENTEQIIEYKENTTYRSLIKEFINLCNEETISEAYAKLSERCKKEKYKTQEEFYINYYKKLFLENYVFEKLEYDNKNNTYIIIFSENALTTGSITNRKQLKSRVKIEETVLESKIYIID